MRQTKRRNVRVRKRAKSVTNERLKVRDLRSPDIREGGDPAIALNDCESRQALNYGACFAAHV
jgi:hypothetical protein